MSIDMRFLRTAAAHGLMPLIALLVVGCTAPLTRESIITKDAPAPIGPYSQGVKLGNMLFLSGQTATDPKTNQLSTGSIEDQTTLSSLQRGF